MSDECEWRLHSYGMFSSNVIRECRSLSTGAVAHTLEGDTEPITALAWSKDGRRVFSASRSMRCSVWDATTGESVRNFKAHGMPAGAYTGPLFSNVSTLCWIWGLGRQTLERV